MILTIEDIIDQGLATLAGIDNDGDPLYAIDWDRVKEISPETYQEQLDEIDRAIIAAIDVGYLTTDWDIAPDGEVKVSYYVCEDQEVV